MGPRVGLDDSLLLFSSCWTSDTSGPSLVMVVVMGSGDNDLVWAAVSEATLSPEVATEEPDMEGGVLRRSVDTQIQRVFWKEGICTCSYYNTR